MSSSVAVIVGSAFNGGLSQKLDLKPEKIETGFGEITLYRSGLRTGKPAYVLPRHGFPHRLLPNQVNYRAQAAALKKAGCRALLINSSVGVMDASLPLYKPMLVTDLLMPENRLPDGTTCTMFQNPSPEQGHLLIKQGLFSSEIGKWLLANTGNQIHKTEQDIIFVYAGGPRGKTPAENRMWAHLGGHVNSMTLAPEVILANELEIPVAALVVGHKYSVPGVSNPAEGEIAETLNNARESTEQILVTFLKEAGDFPFGNEIYRFDS